MAAGDKYTVTASSLRIRSGPGTNYKIVGGLTRGQTVTEIAGSTSEWIKIGKNQYSSRTYLKKITSSTVNTTTTNNTNTGVTTEQKQEQNETTGLDSDGSGYRPIDEIGDTSAVQEWKTTINSESTFYDINNVNGVFGMPYQFLPNADIRLDPTQYAFKGNNNSIGAEFADKIIGKMPVMFIAPGRPNFMTKYSKNDKENIIGKIIREAADLASGSISDLVSTEGKYYTFEYTLKEYYQYVNPMCAIAARYLGIQDMKMNGKKLDNIDWYSWVNNHISGIFNTTSYMHIPFYLDSDTSVNESFDNSVGESSLASTINGLSDMGRELQFLTGYGSKALDVDFLSKNADTLDRIENINSAINDILGKGNFLSNLSKHLNTVASGGRLMFPKIWTDSSMSRSYSVKIKLVSPDCNKLSIFLNILVPLFHLIGLVAPQVIDSNPNGYTSPFIVRAIYKSFFNVDMGIITSMSVSKGGDCMWTVDGLPTSIDVDLDIKDLYETMGITKSSLSNLFSYDTMSNTAEMDYIANLCGINIYKPEIGRQIDMWLTMKKNKITKIPSNIWKDINTTIGGTIMSLYGR